MLNHFGLSTSHRRCHLAIQILVGDHRSDVGTLAWDLLLGAEPDHLVVVTFDGVSGGFSKSMAWDRPLV